MKKILLTILAVILAASVALGIVGAVSFSTYDLIGDEPQKLDTQTTIGDNMAHSFIAEIAYNNLLLQNGSILRSLQFWVDLKALTTNSQEPAIAGKKLQINSALAQIGEMYKAKGYKVTASDCFLEVTLDYFESYTDYYINFGIDGYQKPAGDAVKKTGVFFSKYYSTGSTYFAHINGSITEAAANILKTIQGVDNSTLAYIYNYGTKYSTKLITSDADKIYTFEKLGITIHKYVMLNTNLNRSYTTIQNAPNTISWYAILVAVTLVIAGGFIAIAITERRKSK